MIKPITRKEKLLSAIANDAPVTIQPKTREELFLAQIAEKTSNVPKPLTYDYMPEGYPKEESKEGYILPETTVTFANSQGVIADVIDVNEGKTYTINWNGTDYSCVAQLYTEEGASGVLLGNASASGGNDTGEPFLIICLSSDTAAQVGIGVMFVALDSSESATVSISGRLDTLTPISFDFLPDGYPKVIDGAVHKMDNEYLDLDWLPIYKETRVLLAAEKTVTAIANEPTETTGGFPDLTVDEVSNGMQIIVVWDGKEYPVEVLVGEGDLNATTGFAGNLGFVGGPQTAEPFALMIQSRRTNILCADVDPHVASVYAIEGKPNKIPAVFLPAGYPYKKEGTGVLYSSENSDELFDDMTKPLGLVAGETYTVEINGVAYTGTAEVIDFMGMSGAAMGDVYTMSGGEIGTAPTGDPYALVDFGTPLNGMCWSFAMLEGSNEFDTLVISGTKTEIVTMSPELLPPARKVFVCYRSGSSVLGQATEEEFTVNFTAEDVLKEYLAGLNVVVEISEDSELGLSRTVLNLNDVNTINLVDSSSVRVSFTACDTYYAYELLLKSNTDAGHSFEWHTSYIRST